MERQAGDISLYKFYFQSVSPIMAVCWLGLAVIYIGLGRAPQLWLRFWSEDGMSKNPGYYFGTYVAFATACVIASALSVSFFMLLIVPKSAEVLHGIFLQTVTKAPLWFFSTTDSGQTLNRFSQDMTLFDNRLPVAVYHTIYDVLSVLCSAALIAVGARYFATIIPICAVALYLLAKFYLRTSRQIRHLDLETKSPLYTLLTDTIDGLITIRAFGWKEAFFEDGLNLLDASQKPYYLLFCIQRWLNIMLDLFAAMVAVVLVAFAIKFQGTTTQGALGVALLNIITFNTELTELVNNWTDLEISLGAVSRLRTFLRETPNEDTVNEATPLPEDWPSEGTNIQERKGRGPSQYIVKGAERTTCWYLRPYRLRKIIPHSRNSRPPRNRIRLDQNRRHRHHNRLSRACQDEDSHAPPGPRGAARHRAPKPRSRR
ncbi:ABC transporter type 1, transmembrane domain-containing protein [Hypoxylon cercidicola]|nr:ABC transporter type 1, transmembrane domain-containing protein [Hypoxylon cercidicola]